jgi:plasmid stabilization system protein ParE
MASVVVSAAAQRNLASIIDSHSLPATTSPRVRRALEPLGEFPLLGQPLEGRWAGFRFVLGPWRWMIIVYQYDEALDQVAIVTIRDGRSARSPTAS